MSGVLYVIGIHIGNPKDVTQRCKEKLSELNTLACEDTRDTSRLLKELDLPQNKKLISIFEHQEKIKMPGLIGLLEQGEDVGLVVSRGMPGISDPGYVLIREAYRKGVPVKVIPGISALTAALVVSGLPSDKFIFLGFPPRKGQKQINFFEKYKDLDVTLIFYESPRRLAETLKNLEALFKDWHIAICRELTKEYEEVIRGMYSEVLSKLEEKEVLGECTVLLSRKI